MLSTWQHWLDYNTNETVTVYHNRHNQTFKLMLIINNITNNKLYPYIRLVNIFKSNYKLGFYYKC